MSYTDSAFTGCITFEYDQNGRLLRETPEDDKKRLCKEATYQYTDNTVQITENQPKAVTNTTVGYTFDLAGNLIFPDYGEGSTNNIRYAYTYSKIKMSQNSPRNTFSVWPSFPPTGILDEANWW